MTDYIEIPKWDGPDGFQHYKKRDPIWIKLYTRLHSDDAWLELTAHQRAVLIGIWIEYARSGRHLALTTRSLSARIGLRVMRRDIEHLEEKGFVRILLAERKQTASPDKDQRRENHVDVTNPTVETVLETVNGWSTPAGGDFFDELARRRAAG